MALYVVFGVLNAVLIRVRMMPVLVHLLGAASGHKGVRFTYNLFGAKNVWGAV